MTEDLAEIFSLQTQIDDLEARIEDLQSENAKILLQLARADEHNTLTQKHLVDRISKLDADLHNRTEKSRAQLKRVRQLELEVRRLSEVHSIKVELQSTENHQANTLQTKAPPIVDEVTKVSKESNQPATPLTNLSPRVSPHEHKEIKDKEDKELEDVPLAPPPSTLAGEGPVLVPVAGDLNHQPASPITTETKGNHAQDDDSVPVSYSRGSNDPCEVLGNGHSDDTNEPPLCIAEANDAAPAVISHNEQNRDTEKEATKDFAAGTPVEALYHREVPQGGEESDHYSTATPVSQQLHTGATVPLTSVHPSSASGGGAEKVWPKKHAGRKTNLQYARDKLEEQKAAQLHQDESDRSMGDFRKRCRDSDKEEEEAVDDVKDGEVKLRDNPVYKQPRVTPHSERTLKELNPFEKYRLFLQQNLDQTPAAAFSAALYDVSQSFSDVRGSQSSSVHLPPPPLSAGVTCTFSSNDSLGSGGSFNAYGKKKVNFEGPDSVSTAGTSSKARSKVTDPYEELVLQCPSDHDSSDESNNFKKKGRKGHKKITMI